MKKVGILFLLLIFILSGCGGTDSQQNVSSADVDAQTLYSDFLLKKVSAADKEGNDISFETYLNDNPQSMYRKYAIYDMNGDDIPELIIKTENALDIFWIKNDKVTLWYQGTNYAKPLNNRAILYERSGDAPQHTDYQYIVLDYNGEEMLKVSFSEYFGSDEVYFINEQQVTKTVYENLCKMPVLSIADDAIEWRDILLSEKTEFTTSDNLHTYTVYKNEDSLQSGKTLTILSKASGELVQTISLTENEWFTKKPIYLIDVSFDGYLDIIVPYSLSASAAYFQAYIWDDSQNKYEYAPDYQNIPNVAIDADNNLLLSHRTADKITSYSMYGYSADKNDVIATRSIYWEPQVDSNLMLVKEFSYNIDGTSELLREFNVPCTDSITIDKTDGQISSYFSSDSIWNFDGEKWNNLVIPVSEYNY